MLCFVCVLLCCFWFLIQVMQTFTCCAICLSCKWCVCLCVCGFWVLCLVSCIYILQGTCLSMLHVDDSVSKMAFPVFPYLCAPHCTLIKQCLPKKCNESNESDSVSLCPQFLIFETFPYTPILLPKNPQLRDCDGLHSSLQVPIFHTYCHCFPQFSCSFQSSTAFLSPLVSC